MPSLDAWLADTGDLAALPTETEATRAALAYRRILDKPLSAAFKLPDGTTLSAQTVRVESDDSSTPVLSEAGQSASAKIVVFGIRNHSSLSDTDIKEGYRFVWNYKEYRCQSVILTLGEIQGLFEAI